MAKKTTGASEINGFIAVSNDKPKTTTKPSVQKTISSSSKASSGSKDVKAVKPPASNATVKKAVVSSEVKKVETKSKSVVKPKTTATTKAKPVVKASDNKVKVSNQKASSGPKDPAASKSSPNVGSSVITNAKSTPTKVQSTTSVKSTPVVRPRPAAKTETSSVKTKTAPSSVKRDAPVKKPSTTRTVNVDPKTVKDVKAISGSQQTKSVPKTGLDTKTSSKSNHELKSKSVPKTIGGKKPGQNGSVAANKRSTVVGSQKPKSKAASTSLLETGNAKTSLKTVPHSHPEDDATKSNSTKVLGKSGLSFDITLEPAKVEKPQVIRKTTAEGDVAVDGAKSPVDSIPGPPPLVKQRTFVKDEDDEELKSSLPHIVAPDEVDLSQGTATASQYEEDDFEEYESDFDEEDSDTESSSTESSVSAALEFSEKKVSSARKFTNKETSSLNSNIKKLQTADATDLTNSQGDGAKILDSAPSSAKSAVSENVEPAESTANEYDYEDDFEDYSSDFEEDSESGFTSSNETSDSASSTSTTSSADVDLGKAAGLKGKVVEEEKKLDSGNYDLKTTIMRSDAIKLSQLNYIKEAISRENTMFKDGMPIEKSPSPPPIQIMDFKAAVDKTDKDPGRKRIHRIPDRGKILLSMIKLHEMSYDIFEMQPMSYEAYIKLKGNSNNTQEETQTGEDDVWEETQTDEIIMENKWTQCPLSYHKWAGKDVDWRIYLEDKRGYGTDEVPPLDSKQFFASNYNAKRLQNFVSVAAQVMTVLLEEEAHGFKSTLSLQQSDSNLGFSDGYIPIYCDDIDFLKDRRVTHICFSPHFSNIVVTCYDKSTQPEDYLPVEIMNRWLICLWDMIAISQPLKILVASASVESLAFDCLYSDLLYAGLSDGIICLWDMSEPEMDHDRCRRSNFETILRTPTYCSYSRGIDTKEIHTNPVISLKSTSSSTKRLTGDEVVTPTTLYSLSDDGKLLIWTVVRIPDNSVHQKKIDIRVSPWGRVRLALISVHQPRETAPREVRSNIDFSCMEVKQMNTSLLLGTNMGFVLQYPLTKFKTLTPKFGQINSSIHITDIELCPHDSRCFLVGVSDGSLRLHSELTSRPLKVFTVSNLLGSSITSVRWSNFKPGLIITLDKDSNLLVWNLCQSDLQPVVKMSFKAATDERNEVLKRALTSSAMPPDRLEKIVKFMLPATGLRSGPRISRMDLSRDIRLPYLGIVVSGATVHIHRFSNEFAAKGADIKNQELNILRKYLNLLHK